MLILKQEPFPESKSFWVKYFWVISYCENYLGKLFKKLIMSGWSKICEANTSIILLEVGGEKMHIGHLEGENQYFSHMSRDFNKKALLQSILGLCGPLQGRGRQTAELTGPELQEDASGRDEHVQFIFITVSAQLPEVRYEQSVSRLEKCGTMKGRFLTSVRSRN